MKTLCLCNSTLAWGGGEKWHLEAAVQFAARGWKVLLLCHPASVLCEKARQVPQITVLPFAVTRFSFLNPFTMHALAALLAEHQVHAVIMNLPADLKCVAPAARKAGVRHIVYRRGSAIAVKNSWLNRRLYGMLTGLIVNSEETRRLVLVNNAELIAKERIFLLPNAVDEAAFSKALCCVTPAEEAALLPAFSHHGGSAAVRPFVFGNAGRLNRQKGQHFLLFLAKTLEDRGFPFHLILAGSGERESELKALAQSLGIAHRVTFAGFCENLAPFWKVIDLFVLTSLWEGFGYVVLEAMLAKKPVFAFEVSNIPELVTEGENGRLFALPEEKAQYAECASIFQMADAVVALARDTEQAQRMGEAGFHFARSQFSQQAAMDTLERWLLQ